MTGPERDHAASESDVADDPAHAGSRPAGGAPQEGAADANSTTGTTPNEEFVGRASGDDGGYEELTGAEARAETGDTSTPGG